VIDAAGVIGQHLDRLARRGDHQLGLAANTVG
jgi:hypothetical protein